MQGTHFFHHGEHPWLSIIVSIGTDSKVNFLIIRIRFESGCQLEDTECGHFTEHAIYSVQTYQEEPGGLPAMFLIRRVFISCTLYLPILAHLLTSCRGRDDSVTVRFYSTW